MVDAWYPKTLEEAVRILGETGGIPLAGGTDLMVQHRRSPGTPAFFEGPVVYIGDIGELTSVTVKNGVLSIGAGVTLSQLLARRDIPRPLRLTLEGIGSPGIRNSATLGGNICNASPAADSLPALYCLDASVEVLQKGSAVLYPIDRFITGPGTTFLFPGDILMRVLIPLETPTEAFYRKIGTRRANALSKLSFLGLHTVTDNTVSDIRIAFGAVSPRVLRIPEAEKSCIGKTPDEIRSVASDIAELYAPGIRPINDQRSTADYRKRTALRLLEHYLTKELS